MEDPALRSEREKLVEALRAVLVEQAGAELVEHLEELRALARARRAGDVSAGAELVRRIAQAELLELRAIARAFCIFFDLANLAEDRHRIRVLRQRERERHPRPRQESLADAVARLALDGCPPERLAEVLAGLTIEPVFTAHPTEAKRRTGRSRLRRLRHCLAELDEAELLPAERAELEAGLLAEMTAVWQTDLLRRRPPSVLEEVDLGLFFAGTLWQVVPRLHRDLAEAVGAQRPDQVLAAPPLLTFGSWIGGDRDGNPNVSAQITRETLIKHRQEALTLHLEQARALRHELTCSVRQVPVDDALAEAVEGSEATYRGVRRQLARHPADEVNRRWLSVIQWRLERTLDSDPFDDPLVGAYRRAAELEGDLRLLADSLTAHGGQRLVEPGLRAWIDRVRVFGFHLLRLDLRQEAGWLRTAAASLLDRLGQPGFESWDEPARVALLSEQLASAEPLPTAGLSPEARELTALFSLYGDAAAVLGGEALGGFVISLTTGLADVLTVLWLATRFGLAGPQAVHHLPIVPLFETIGDLRRAPEIVADLLAHPAYRAHLEALDRRQMIMIGYSDSCKDGGYLTAQWHLEQAQRRMLEVGAGQGVRLLFFHGRGGSLGRGGGPAADAIRSLQAGSVATGLRVTEQGEVLADRYDDPAIAYRHLEQVIGAVLLAACGRQEPPERAWLEVAAELSEDAWRAYRALVEDDGFLPYFRTATPIDAVEAMPLASRPARRRQHGSLADLRAIPWTFAWIQSRHLLPAWYGLGSALTAGAERRGWDLLHDLYQHWPFFQVAIDHAALALGKTDLDIARRYASRRGQAGRNQRLIDRITEEFERSTSAVLAITGRPTLLSAIPWLEAAIALRNPYVDVLNLVQIELLDRVERLTADSPPADREVIEEVLRLTIGGIAAGMRATG